MSTLTVLIIAKDEASVIDRCLSSLYYEDVYDDIPVGKKRPLWDELWVVDTGSSDDTCEIAKKHGAKIANFPWVNDFAAARNFAEGLATKDYVFWIDADEELIEGHQLVRTIVETNLATSIRPQILLALPDGTFGRPFDRQDLLHKRGSHHWEGIVQEWTVGGHGPAEPRILYREIPRPEGDKPHSWEAHRKMAEEDLSDRALFFLAAKHGQLGHFVESIAIYDFMLSLPGPPNTMRARACWMKGHIYRSKGDYGSAVRNYLDAIYQCPELAEPYYYLGEMFLEANKPVLALSWLNASVTIPQHEFSYDLDVYTTLRHQKLQECIAQLQPMEVAGAPV